MSRTKEQITVERVMADFRKNSQEIDAVLSRQKGVTVKKQIESKNNLLGRNFDQKEIVAALYDEIDVYLNQLKQIVDKREKISSDANRLTILSTILPIILAPVTGIAAVISEQYWITFINLVNAIPPILTKINGNKIKQCNDCSDLQIKFTNIKGSILTLAAEGALNAETITEIRKAITDRAAQLSEYLRIVTAN